MLAQHRLRIVLLFAALLVCVTSWHYVDCAQQTPPRWEFLGVTYNFRDQSTYLMWMAQARAGRFFFDNLYTPEKEKPGYCNLLWWGMGTLARLTGLSLISVYHLSRVLFILAFLLLLDRFIADFLTDEQERWCAFWLITVGAGLGWLLILFSRQIRQVLLCADLWIPEGFAFLSMLWFPHFVFALILQVGIFWLFLSACERGRPSRAWGAGLMTLVLGFTHTYHLPTIYVVASVFALLQDIRSKSGWRCLKYAALIVGLSLPALIYFSYIVRVCPSMAAWKQQNVCRSPAVWGYVLGFGTTALLPLLFPRQLAQLKEQSPRQLFLFTWLTCNAALLYASPLGFERRLVQGLQIPLTLLSVQIFFRAVYPHLLLWRLFENNFLSHRARKNLVIGGWVLFSALTSFGHLTMTSFRILPPRSPEYLSPDEVAAADYLRRHAGADEVILAPEPQGMWLPLLTERRVFVGHPGLTANYPQKSRLASRFFSGKMRWKERAQWLRDNGVDFIYYPRRKKEGLTLHPAWVKVFQSGRVDVYHIAPSSTVL
jgi:hypothetical protein